MRTPDLLAATLAASSALSFFLAGFGLSRRGSRGAVEFSGFMGASAIYALGYALELGCADLPGMLGALRFQYLGIPFICYCWLLFALRFTGLERPFRILRPVLAAPAVAAVLLFWTNDLHGWFYVRSWVRTDAPFPLIGVVHGPAYWIHVGIAQVELMAGIAVLLAYARRARHRHRSQALTAAFASAFPMVVFLAYLAGATPWHLDISPLGTVCSGLLFSWAIFRLGILELVPAARELAIDSLRDGFLVLDRKGVVADANAAARHLLAGVTVREGLPIADPGGNAPWLPGVIALARGERRGPGSERLEIRAVQPGGDARHLALEALPLRDPRGRLTGSVVVIRDVTELTVLMDRLTEMAVTDELTGLFNRRRFQELGSREAGLAQRTCRPLAVALLDVDHFKLVNDHYGHDAGDAALKEVARRLSRALRAGDVLCRYGGEEFALLLPDTGPAGAALAFERFRLAVRGAPVIWGDTAIPVTLSLGYHAAVPAQGEGLETFLTRADEALYRAKSLGRDRCEAWTEGPPAPLAR